jgi:hypothetical protein
MVLLMKTKLTIYKLKKLLNAGYTLIEITGHPFLGNFEYKLIDGKLKWRSNHSKDSNWMLISCKNVVDHLNQADYIIDTNPEKELYDIINK